MFEKYRQRVEEITNELSVLKIEMEAELASKTEPITTPDIFVEVGKWHHLMADALEAFSTAEKRLDKQAKDLRRTIKSINHGLGGTLCVIQKAKPGQVEDLKFETEHTKVTNDVKFYSPVPNFSKDSIAYREFYEKLGFPADIVATGAIALNWERMNEFFGVFLHKECPVDLGKQYCLPNVRVIRKKKV